MQHKCHFQQDRRTFLFQHQHKYTSVHFQITIDTSPPHTGIVQDGVKGIPEVDFQQSTLLQAHWDGFFDRESGVLFYQYGFHTEPLSATDFHLDSGTQSVCYMYNVLVTTFLLSKSISNISHAFF